MTDAARLALVRSLRDSWDVLLDRITAAVVEQVPAFRGLEARDLRASFDRIARFFAASIAAQPVPKESLRSVRLLGVQRARDGFEFHAVVAAAAVAVNVCVDHFGGLLDQGGLADADGARLMQLVVVPMCDAHSAVVTELAAGFQEGRSTPAAGASPEVRFVEQVLFRADEPEAVTGEAVRLGYSAVSRWGVALVVGAVTGSIREVRAALPLVEGIEGVIEGPASHRPAPHVALLLATPSDEAWHTLAATTSTALKRSDAALVVAKPGRLVDAHPRYERVSRNIEFVRLLPGGGYPIDPALLQLFRTLAESPDTERAELFRDVLGDLLADPKGDMYLSLLEALGATGSQRMAGELLGFDESTVYRHLKRIEKLTGRAWQNHRDQLAMSSAIVCRRLAAQDLADYDANKFGAPPDFRLLRGPGR